MRASHSDHLLSGRGQQDRRSPALNAIQHIFQNMNMQNMHSHVEERLSGHFARRECLWCL